MTAPRPRITLGRILYLLYHRPAGVIGQCLSNGGPYVQWHTRRGEQNMRAAAANLVSPLVPADAPVCELHLLTGQRYWHQTAFCLWTFASHSRRRIAPVIHDDGSLTGEQVGHLRRLFPLLRLQTHAESAARVEKLLPKADFPALHERWINYPHIRKLINPHLGSKGAKLVLDSDLLFFRKPDFILDWLRAPERPLHAEDIETAYGYPADTLSALAGAPLAPQVNVGLAGLFSEQIDWQKLEHWTASLIARHGTHYVLEQALFAMLVAGRSCAVAPGADYVTCPRPPEAQSPRAVMHHFVADSKRWYFQRDWSRLPATF